MTAIPATFRAFVATRDGEDVTRGVGTFAESDLPAGEVEIRVGWSSVNFKDGLATIPNGKVARISPLIPGIDLAGEVVASEDATIPVGVAVLAHGYELGVSRHGGFAEYQRVPANWVVPMPAGLTPRLAMAVGTAGFTAALSVVALEERGLRPSHGPVLVTGASGGVGSTAVGILAGRGYEVWAASGKPDEAERLRALGAAGAAHARGGHRGEREAAGVGALGRRRRLRRRGHPAVRPAHPPAGRDRRRVGQHRRSRVRHDGLPVHPAVGRARRDRFGAGADRRTARDVGADRHATCAPTASARGSRR